MPMHNAYTDNERNVIECISVPEAGQSERKERVLVQRVYVLIQFTNRNQLPQAKLPEFTGCALSRRVTLNF